MAIKKNRFAKSEETNDFNFVTFDQLMQRSVPKTMAIAATEPIGNLQIRSMNIDPATSTNREWVEELASKIRRDPELKPDTGLVIAGVTVEGSVVRTVRLDGNHFISAYLMVAKETFLAANPDASETDVSVHMAAIELPVKYVECTQDELESASYGTNAMHGLQLNNSEKVALARRMLAKYPHLADGAIEKLAPVLIAKTIGNQRKWMADPKNLQAALKVVPHTVSGSTITPDNPDLKVEDGHLVFPSKRLGANGKWMETETIGAQFGKLTDRLSTPGAVPELVEGMPDWATDTSVPAPAPVAKSAVILSDEQKVAAKNGKFLPAQESGELVSTNGVVVSNPASAKPAAPVAETPVTPKASVSGEMESLPGGGKVFNFGAVSFMTYHDDEGQKVSIDDGINAVDIGFEALAGFIKAYRAHQVTQGVATGK